MKSLKKFRNSILIIVGQIVTTIYFGISLPANVKIPFHFNIRGEIDQYVSKSNGIILFAAINIFILLLMMIFPYYSPRYKKKPERFNKIMPQLTSTLIFFFFIIQITLLSYAKWKFIDPKIISFSTMGLLFIMIGNLFPKIPSNFFVGIRTPWTLSSENVWRKTHRIGALTFVIGGIILIANGFIKSSLLNLIFGGGSILLVVIIPIIYSFRLYQMEKS